MGAIVRHQPGPPAPTDTRRPAIPHKTMQPRSGRHPHYRSGGAARLFFCGRFSLNIFKRLDHRFLFMAPGRAWSRECGQGLGGWWNWTGLTVAFGIVERWGRTGCSRLFS